MKEIKLLSFRFALFLLLVVIITPVFFLAHLQPNNRAEVFFPEDAPVRVLEKELRQQFPEDDVLIVLFSSKQAYSDDYLEVFESIVSELERNPLIERVISMTTMDHILGSDDGFKVESVLKKDEVQHLSEQQRLERVIQDRFAPGRVVSIDGAYQALIIRPVSLKSSLDNAAIETFTRKVITEHGLMSDVVAIAGNIEIEVAMFETMLDDNMRFIPATIILGIILLWWLFRRILPIVLVLLFSLVAVNSALFFVVILGQPFSMPVSMITPLLTSLCIAFFIHFFNAFLQATTLGYQGITRIKRVLAEVERPVRFTVLTTMAGLISLGLSPLPPIQTFGYAAAFGLLVLYFLVIWVLPPLLNRWDKGDWQIKSSGMVSLNRIIINSARLSIRYAGFVVTGVVILLLLGGTQLLKVKAETDLLLYFPQQHPLIVSDHLISQKIAGTTPLEIIFDGVGRDSLKEPDVLKEIKSIQQWVQALPEVDTTISMVNVVEEMHWAFHSENPKYRDVPDSRSIISQYLFIYDGKDLFDLVDSEFQRTRLQMSLNVHGAREIRAVMEKIEEHLKSQPVQLKWQFAGGARMFSDQEKLLIDGQLKSGAGAFILIFLCLAFFWRSFKPAFIAMLPNISPIIFIFVTMGLLGITLDIGTAIVLSVAIGIAVDDTIHLYDAYLRRVKIGVQPVIALMRAYRTAGRAVFATSIILCGQFFFLAFSSFIPTHQFGLMTGIGLLAALVFDILLLPAILALGIKQAKKA